MRENLFRGQQVSNGKWAYGYYVSCAYLPENTIQHCIVTFPGSPENYHEVFANTVGQYTGLTDKAGKKAFEGDCVRALVDDAIGIVRYGEYRNPFNDDEFACHIGYFVDWVAGEDKDFLRKDLGYWLNLVDIIGNVHDNPELLETEV